MRTETQKSQTSQTKQAWEPMRLQAVGHIRNVLQIGGGKLSVVGGDVGDSRKSIFCG